MPISELHCLTIAQASALIAGRKLSPVEYVKALLERIDTFDPQVRAFITKTGELACRLAREAEHEIANGRHRGRLHGIPFGLKDIINTAGIRTSAHSKVFIDNVPAENATVVQRLLDAGAVLMGKLAAHEFAASGGVALDLPWPPARNPWNTAHFSGSSSSGSGAAVAAGFVPMALGSDTGGSIRIPAALCGVAGIKPTYGLVSRYGVIPASFTFDHVGPLTWTAEDCAIVLQALAGYDPRDPASASRPVTDYTAALRKDIRGLRIGVLRHFWEDEGPTDPEMAQAMEDALTVLRELGAIVGDARIRTREAYNDVKMVIAKTETFAIHEKALGERPHDFGVDFVARNLTGILFSGLDYVRAQRERRKMVDEMTPLYERFDVLLTSTNAPAARLDRLIGSAHTQKWENPNIYTPFNVTGGPALVVCNGYTKAGLPLAMQIAGRPFDEATVLRVGHAYEEATAWRKRRPSLDPGALASELHEPVRETTAPATDAATRAIVDAAIARAHLTLAEQHRALLYAAAPPVLAAVERIRREHGHADEPASVFSF